MCLIAWNWQPGSETPLLLLSNRDEFYARPTLPLHWWNTDAGAPITMVAGRPVLAGKDLQAGGTWLGLSRSGRLAALTNHRTAKPARTDTPSRGELVANFLGSDMSAGDYLAQLAHRAGDYNPFNFLVFDGQQLMGLESRGANIVAMQPGIGGVSNADFQTPWPKLVRLKERLHGQLHKQVGQGAVDRNSLLPLLHDQAVAPDSALPQTGVPLALERILSSTFIATPDYGTRACSVIQMHAQHAEFSEQRFDAGGWVATEHVSFQF